MKHCVHHERRRIDCRSHRPNAPPAHVPNRVSEGTQPARHPAGLKPPQGDPEPDPMRAFAGRRRRCRERERLGEGALGFDRRRPSAQRGVGVVARIGDGPRTRGNNGRVPPAIASGLATAGIVGTEHETRAAAGPLLASFHPQGAPRAADEESVLNGTRPDGPRQRLGNAAAPPRPPCRDSLREVRMTARGFGDGDAGDPVGSSGPRTGRAGPGTHRSTRRLDPSPLPWSRLAFTNPIQRSCNDHSLGKDCRAPHRSRANQAQVPTHTPDSHTRLVRDLGPRREDSRGPILTLLRCRVHPGSAEFTRPGQSQPSPICSGPLNPPIVAAGDWACQFAEPTAGAPTQAGHTPVTPPVDHRERQADAAHPARTHTGRARAPTSGQPAHRSRGAQGRNDESPSRPRKERSPRPLGVIAEVAPSQGILRERNYRQRMRGQPLGECDPRSRRAPADRPMRR